MNKNIIIRILLLSLPFIAIVLLWFYKNKQIEEICLLFECLIMFILLCLTLQETITRKIASSLCLCLVSIIITLSYHKGFGSALVMFSLLLGACIFNNLIVSLTTYRWLHAFTAFLLFSFLLTLNYQIANIPYVPSKYTDIMLNPNTVGIIWFAFIAHFLCFTKTFQQTSFLQKLFLKIFNIVMIIISIYFIYWTECRSALLSLFVFLILLFCRKQSFSIKTYYYLGKCLLILSMLFVIVYLMRYSYFMDIQILGKGIFSGRQIIWKSALDFISEYPFFGSGNDFIYESVRGQIASSHNFLIGIWKMFGIIPTIAVIFLLTSTHSFNSQICIEKTAQFAFISSLFIGFFEAFLIGSNTYVFFLLFLICLIHSESLKDLELKDKQIMNNI